MRTFLTSALACCISFAVNAKDMQHTFFVDELKCENLIDPLGIDNTSPHFSWKMKGEGWKGGQKAYEIQVSSDSVALVNGNADLWKSGKVKSDASVMVPYKGIPLTSRTLCYWRVKVWNAKGRCSDWSKPARFGVGILDNGMKGAYIGAAKESISSPIMRKKVRIDQSGTALLHVNSLGYHEVYVNGRKVGNEVLSPAVAQLGKRSLIVTYDITPFLQHGDNNLVIWLGHGWFKKSNYKHAYGGPLVKAELDIQDKDGCKTVAVTDSSWTCYESGYTDTGLWSALLFGGEKVDGRLLPADLSPATLDALHAQPVVEIDVPAHKATPQMCEGNRIFDRLTPVSVKPIGDNAWLLDMGRIQTGWFEMQMPSLPAGHEVTIDYSDDLGQDGQFEWQGERDTYISGGKEGERFCNKFNHHAFRFVRLSNLPVKPEKEGCRSLQIHGDYAQAATFECSDQDLNAIHDLIQYTAKCLTFGGYMVDCPHLERMGYGGDGNSSTLTVQTLYDMAPTFANWLQGWEDTMRPDGGGPYWCAFYVLAPWRTLLNYGDEHLVRRHYEKMKGWFDYVDRYTVDGLLKRWPDTDYRGWYLGDWLAPIGVDAGAQSSVDLVSNCCISQCLDVMSRIARRLGKETEADSFDVRRERLNTLLHATFYNPAEGTYATGSQLDMCYPMLTGVVPEELRDQVRRKTIELTRTRHNDHLAVGLVSVPILTEWAVREHQPDFMYCMLKQRDYPGYLYMIDHGATATWESWDRQRSRVHNCYNGIGTWFYQAVGGIRPEADAPGYRHVTIAPQMPEGLTWAKTTKETPYGTIAVDWERKDGRLVLQVSVPAGVTASVCQPARATDCLMNGKAQRTDAPVTLKGTHATFQMAL